MLLHLDMTNYKWGSIIDKSLVLDTYLA